jgi:hypothetical protein
VNRTKLAPRDTSSSLFHIGPRCPVPKIIAWTNPLELVEKRALLRRMSPVVADLLQKSKIERDQKIPRKLIF